MAVTSAVLAAFIVASSTFATSFAASNQPIGCFQFSSGGNPIGAAVCNQKANDLTIFFKWGGNCIAIFGTAGNPCPKGSNNIDFSWAVSPTGAPQITKCVWTKGGVVLSNPCNVPPGTSTFKLLNIQGTATTIFKVFFTLNGVRIGKVFKPPAGIVVNNVEFHFG